jgi:hypothetical protein
MPTNHWLMKLSDRMLDYADQITADEHIKKSIRGFAAEVRELESTTDVEVQA